MYNRVRRKEGRKYNLIYILALPHLMYVGLGCDNGGGTNFGGTVQVGNKEVELLLI